MSQTTHQTSGPFYIGIDFHKHYSVFCVIDARNSVLERGRIEHKLPIGFELLPQGRHRSLRCQQYDRLKAGWSSGEVPI